jgi:protein-tyrosine phosphatase
MKKIKILFVCTGNIFRSMSAEYCLKKYLRENKIKNIEVSSAGTVAQVQPADPVVVKTLREFGINPSKHVQRKLTKKILKENDIIIVMAKMHQDYIKDHFGLEVPLYNQITFNKPVSVDDINDVYPNWNDENMRPKVAKHLEKIVRYIHKTIPKLTTQIEKQFIEIS